LSLVVTPKVLLYLILKEYFIGGEQGANQETGKQETGKRGKETGGE